METTFSWEIVMFSNEFCRIEGWNFLFQKGQCKFQKIQKLQYPLHDYPLPESCRSISRADSKFPRVQFAEEQHIMQQNEVAHRWGRSNPNKSHQTGPIFSLSLPVFSPLPELPSMIKFVTAAASALNSSRLEPHRCPAIHLSGLQADFITRAAWPPSSSSSARATVQNRQVAGEPYASSDSGLIQLIMGCHMMS